VKILFIHNRYQQAGGEDVAFNAEVELFKQQHEVFELLFDNDNITTAVEKVRAGIAGVYNFSSAKKVNAIIKVFNPDIIHIHNLFFNVSPSVLFEADRSKIPVIITLHNYRLICCNALLLRNNRICELCINKKMPHYGIKYKCYRKSAVGSAMLTAITGIHKYMKTWSTHVAQYVCLTDFAKTKFINSSLAVNGNQLTVVPNFVFDANIKVKKRGDFFLYVGRISEEKGVELLVKAFSTNAKQKLIIIGDGPLKDDLENQYVSLNTSFIGKKEKSEVMDLMGRCKALIFPSLCYEGMPFTIIEAFSTGTPVIASNLGAMADMIKDEVNGFHFNANDEEDLRRAINKFNQLSEEEYQAMSAQARLSYEQNYHPETHYKAMMSIYEKAIQNYHNAH
jgi:glycosyltransferase involved in cell wall biosynthesis